MVIVRGEAVGETQIGFCGTQSQVNHQRMIEIDGRTVAQRWACDRTAEEIAKEVIKKAMTKSPNVKVRGCANAEQSNGEQNG
jgi:hypothetical protein